MKVRGGKKWTVLKSREEWRLGEEKKKRELEQRMRRKGRDGEPLIIYDSLSFSKQPSGPAPCFPLTFNLSENQRVWRPDYRLPSANAAAAAASVSPSPRWDHKLLGTRVNLDSFTSKQPSCRSWAGPNHLRVNFQSQSFIYLFIYFYGEGSHEFSVFVGIVSSVFFFFFLQSDSFCTLCNDLVMVEPKMQV